jgi:predicted GNAT family acetyltransferase
MEEPRVVDNREAPQYELYVGDELAGFLQYSRRNGTIALLHTEVDEAFAGQGLAGRLVAAALEDIRDQGLEMVPVCPYVRSYLARHVTTD